MTRRRLPWPAALLALSMALVWAAPLLGPSPALPSKLTDQEFWELTERVSEPNGDFQSDNFLSNERGYQVVIPDLVADRQARAACTSASGPSRTFRTSSR